MQNSSRQILSIATAVAAAAGVLLLAGGGGAVAPFGFITVVLAHLLAALPLAWLAASMIVGKAADAAVRPKRLAGFILFAALALLSVLLGPLVIGPVLAGSQSFVRAVRVAWCLALLTPACVVAASFVAARPAAAASRTGALGFIVSLLVAAILPAAYVDDLTRRQTATAANLLVDQHLGRALPIVKSLDEVGSSYAIGPFTAEEAHQEVAERVARIEVRLAQSLPEDPPGARRFERARLLASLDRLPEAIAALDDLADTDVDAALFQAGVLQAMGRTEASSFWFRVVEQQLGERNDEAALAGRRRVFDGLAFNARTEHRYQDAEAHYRGGLTALPGAKGHFHLRLAQHYQQAGRPRAAMDELRAAVELDPALSAQATDIERELRINTPACLFK